MSGPTLLEALEEIESERAAAELSRRLAPAAPPPDRRIVANLAALRLMRALIEEERAPTPEERRVMNSFTPWQALPNIFKPDPRYADVRAELQEILGDEEAANLYRGTPGG